MVYRYVGLLILFIYVFKIISIKKIDLYLLWVIIFYFIIIFSTIYNQGSLTDAIRSIFPSFALCLIFYYYSYHRPDQLVKSISILEIYVLLNLITILLNFHPDVPNFSGERYWLFGNKNFHIRTILPILANSLIISNYNNKIISMHSLCLIIISLFSILLSRSATGIVGIFLFLLMYFIFVFKGYLKNIVKIKYGVAVSAFASFGIIFFNLQTKFSFIVENILGKDLTFSGRSIIWKKSIEMVRAKPFFGFGYLTSSEYTYFLGNNHPHNYYLYILTMGGIVLFALLLLGFYLADKNLNDFIDTGIQKILAITIIVFLFMGIDESLTRAPLLYPFILLAMEINHYSFVARAEPIGE